jgi:hypothetical protein
VTSGSFSCSTGTPHGRFDCDISLDASRDRALLLNSRTPNSWSKNLHLKIFGLRSWQHLVYSRITIYCSIITWVSGHRRGQEFHWPVSAAVSIRPDAMGRGHSAAAANEGTHSARLHAFTKIKPRLESQSKPSCSILRRDHRAKYPIYQRAQKFSRLTRHWKPGKFRVYYSESMSSKDPETPVYP